MNINTLDYFFSTLSMDEMSLLYSGDFSDAVTDEIIELSGVQLDEESGKVKIQRKNGFLIAECFQNIVRHNDSNIQNGYFLTRIDEGVVYIASGNVIANNMIEELSGKLNHLNSLTKEELKEVYVNTLSNNTLSDKGGAGLGLIEMARKTGNKLDFRFEKIDDTMSYFYFQLRFEALNEMNAEDERTHNIESTIKLRQDLLSDQIFMVYKGDVSSKTVVPLLTMVEQSIQASSDEPDAKDQMFKVLSEFLQNMSKHGALINGKQHGLVLIGTENDRYVIGGVNYVNAEDKERLEKILNHYVNLPEEELATAFESVLKEGDKLSEKGSSIGVITMAMARTALLEYNFTKTETGQYLYSLLLKI